MPTPATRRRLGLALASLLVVIPAAGCSAPREIDPALSLSGEPAAVSLSRIAEGNEPRLGEDVRLGRLVVRLTDVQRVSPAEALSGTGWYTALGSGESSAATASPSGPGDWEFMRVIVEVRNTADSTAALEPDDTREAWMLDASGSRRLPLGREITDVRRTTAEVASWGLPPGSSYRLRADFPMEGVNGKVILLYAVQGQERPARFEVRWPSDAR